jgi:hypothetical protein
MSGQIKNSIIKQVTINILKHDFANVVLELIKELVKTFGGCQRTSYLKPIRGKIKQDKTCQNDPPSHETRL